MSGRWPRPRPSTPAPNAAAPRPSGRASVRSAAPGTRWSRRVATPAAVRFESVAGTRSAITSLGVGRSRSTTTHTYGLEEFDRVLGGGLVAGGVVLIGGDPGIGKSTLLLQAAAALGAARRTLYVTGEESVEQIALRAQRLGLVNAPVELLAEVQLEAIVGGDHRDAARDRGRRLDPDRLHRGAAVRARQRRAGPRMRGATDAARQAARRGRDLRRPRDEGGRDRRARGCSSTSSTRSSISRATRIRASGWCARSRTGSAPPTSSACSR